MRGKIYFENKCIGYVEMESSEMFRVEGKILLNEEGEKLTFFFNFIIDDDFKRGIKKPDFDIETYLDDSKWHIIKEDGTRHDIWSPVVYPDGKIYWKWKSEIKDKGKSKKKKLF